MNQSDYDLVRVQTLNDLIERRKALNGNSGNGNAICDRTQGANTVLQKLASHYRLEYKPIAKEEVELR
jgi:hypothetical protein